MQSKSNREYNYYVFAARCDTRNDLTDIITSNFSISIKRGNVDKELVEDIVMKIGIN